MMQHKSFLKRNGGRLLILFSAFALLAPLIANHRPLYINYKGHHLFPAFSFEHISGSGNEKLDYDFTDFKSLKVDHIIFAPVTWFPGRSDFLNTNVGPFSNQYITDLNGHQQKMPLRFRHWLGTNSLGADVLAGLIYGFRYSFFIGLLAVLIASLIGIILGAVAGYFGNQQLKIRKSALICFLLAAVYFIFFIIKIWYYQFQFTSSSTFVVLILKPAFILLACLFLSLLLKKILEWISPSYFTGSISIPVDHLVSRLIEITISVPRLILVITLASIFRPTLISLGVILGFSLWTEIARFTRAQCMQIKSMEFISAARTLGFTDSRILFKHILLNGLGPVLVVICFAFSNVILTESGLSFLGIGLPGKTVTWGSIISSARGNHEAWWLVVFPGICILVTVLTLNSLADYYHKTSNAGIEKDIL